MSHLWPCTGCRNMCAALCQSWPSIRLTCSGGRSRAREPSTQWSMPAGEGCSLPTARATPSCPRVTSWAFTGISTSYPVSPALPNPPEEEGMWVPDTKLSVLPSAVLAPALERGNWTYGVFLRMAATNTLLSSRKSRKEIGVSLSWLLTGSQTAVSFSARPKLKEECVKVSTFSWFLSTCGVYAGAWTTRAAHLNFNALK